MKHIQLSSLSQAYSQSQFNKPEQVWAIELTVDGVPLELIDNLSERCKRWVGWGFYTTEISNVPFLLFESKEEAFVAELSLGKTCVYN